VILAELFAAPSVVVLAALVVVAGPVLRFALRRRGRGAFADDLGALTWPVRALAATVVVRAALGGSWAQGSEWVDWAAPTATLLVIAAAAWVVTRALEVLKLVTFRRLRIDVANNQRARSRRTQLQLVLRVAGVFVWTTAVVIGLLTFEPVRDLGPALVAYAGIIGVVLGLALRAPLENLVSGIIVAVSEPIRIEDVVVVEGEWGNVEDIDLTHVVVRLWDKRRLVLPTSYFVNEPFQNWTRHGATVVGSVTLSVDFEVPVDEVRHEFERLVNASSLWDGDVCTLQVVDMAEQAVQLRGIASARTAGDAWDLRCAVREGLLAYLQHDRHGLPRVRTQPFDGDGHRPAGDARSGRDGAAVDAGT
jgi:small-conductance mechanosensitive channel